MVSVETVLPLHNRQEESIVGPEGGGGQDFCVKRKLLKEIEKE